ncbi:hypothetical protein [Bounagaea algeriensis]
MRQVALRAAMLLLLPFGMVLMHQVPLPALPGAHASPAASQHGDTPTAAVPHAAAPDAAAPDASSPEAGATHTGAGAHEGRQQMAAHPTSAHSTSGNPNPAHQLSAQQLSGQQTSAQQFSGQQSLGPQDDAEHHGAGCGWLLHLCMAVLTAALGIFALRGRGVRVVPQRGTPAARSPRVLSRPRPPPHPYVLCVLRL